MGIDYKRICHSEALAEESIEQGFTCEILHCVQNDKGAGSVRRGADLSHGARVGIDYKRICHSEALAEESIEQGFTCEILHCVQNDKGADSVRRGVDLSHGARVGIDYKRTCHSEALAEESIEQSFTCEILHCVQNDRGTGLIRRGRWLSTVKALVQHGRKS